MIMSLIVVTIWFSIGFIGTIYWKTFEEKEIPNYCMIFYIAFVPFLPFIFHWCGLF